MNRAIQRQKEKMAKFPLPHLLSAERDFVIKAKGGAEGAGKFGRSESVADFLAVAEQTAERASL